MPESLTSFLVRRTARSFRYLREQLNDVTDEDAVRDRHPAWPGHRWGIGQDGSIAGIVYHVGAWKSMTLPLLTENRLLSRAEFEAREEGIHRDWPELVAWLDELGAAWQKAVAGLPEAAFDEEREWEGKTLPVYKLVAEMADHDVQHAAQLEYLAQRHRADGNTD